MPRVISNVRQLLDHVGDARQRPEIGAEAVRRRPLPQRSVDRAQLSGVESRQTAGSPRSAKRRHATASPLTMPPTHALAACLKPLRDVRLDDSSNKQAGGPLSPPLQPKKVPTGSERSVHTDNITLRAPFVTVLRETQ
jgi:hypothetical protein